MGKYDPLSVRLAGHSGAEWRASFAELEKVLGFPLPKGARTGKAWWKNDAAAPHSRAWTDAGWEAAADPAAGQVTFHRKAAAAPAPSPRVPAPVASDEPAILQRLEATPKWTFGLVATGLTIAAGLSVFAIRGWMRRR
jgi:hypothetical protein